MNRVIGQDSEYKQSSLYETGLSTSGTINKKLPPLPRHINNTLKDYTSPFGVDTPSIASTTIDSVDYLDRKNSFSSDWSGSLASTINDDYGRETKDSNLSVDRCRGQMGAESERCDSIMIATEAIESKKLSFLNMDLYQKEAVSVQPQYYMDLEAYKSDLQASQTTYGKMKEVFTKKTLMYGLFGFVSFSTTLIFTVFLTLFLLTQYFDPTSPSSFYQYRYSVLVYYVYLMYTKIYQFGVVISTLKTKSNTQVFFLLLYLFLFTIMELLFTTMILLVQNEAVQSVLEAYKENGIDIFHDHGKHPVAEKQFREDFYNPKVYCITITVCTCVFFVIQVLMWIFYIVQEFSWDTFRKTGASIRARKIIEDAQLTHALLVILGGLIPPFFICAYIVPLENTPFYVNGLVLAVATPFILVLNGWAYKKKRFSGLLCSLCFYCYLFFNLVQMLTVLEAIQYRAAIIIQYYSAGFIFLVIIAIFILDCKKLIHCEINLEISEKNLNAIYLTVINFTTFMIGILELVFFIRYDSTSYKSIQYANNWMISYLFGFCYSLFLSAICFFKPESYINFLGIYVVWILNGLALVFQFANIMFTVDDDVTRNIGQGLQLGFIGLLSLSCCLITWLLAQIFRNHSTDDLGSHNTNKLKTSQKNEIFDFQVKKELGKLLEYNTAFIIVFTYLICIFSMQFVRYKTVIWRLSSEQTIISICITILMVIINFVNYFVIHKMERCLLGSISSVIFSTVYMAYHLYSLIYIGTKYSTIENASWLPETTDLKISMSLSTILILACIANISLSGRIIKAQRSLLY
ncbi:hypothetical protein DASC09_044740 [Saccharomycopsis crataegensis]|uniref:Uncharacterized protein n=1 Tax=Saccharomycopsis crataegensis TaxID=43959 RepID=A0AAV5QQX3_9ASCO|nr:hypothetical protein DASC09_044740 [Saccharomycopsis crataegensis]